MNTDEHGWELAFLTGLTGLGRWDREDTSVARRWRILNAEQRRTPRGEACSGRIPALKGPCIPARRNAPGSCGLRLLSPGGAPHGRVTLLRDRRRTKSRPANQTHHPRRVWSSSFSLKTPKPRASPANTPTRARSRGNAIPKPARCRCHNRSDLGGIYRTSFVTSDGSGRRALSGVYTRRGSGPGA